MKNYWKLSVLCAVIIVQLRAFTVIMQPPVLTYQFFPQREISFSPAFRIFSLHQLATSLVLSARFLFILSISSGVVWIFSRLSKSSFFLSFYFIENRRFNLWWRFWFIWWLRNNFWNLGIVSITNVFWIFSIVLSTKCAFLESCNRTQYECRFF